MKYLLNLVVIKPSTPQTITSEKATTHFARKDPPPPPQHSSISCNCSVFRPICCRYQHYHIFCHSPYSLPKDLPQIFYQSPHFYVDAQYFPRIIEDVFYFFWIKHWQRHNRTKGWVLLTKSRMKSSFRLAHESPVKLTRDCTKLSEKST